ncbi:hypothetical protein TRVL_04126 [Trypanosoma vivax]|nr:hypothetical protein TRVL_04126 [Trypanosoma vivax]
MKNAPQPAQKYAENRILFQLKMRWRIYGETVAVSCLGVKKFFENGTKRHLTKDSVRQGLPGQRPGRGSALLLLKREKVTFLLDLHKRCCTPPEAAAIQRG